MAKVNQSNLNFIKDVFGYGDDDIHQNYPEYNYRLRLAGFTEYNPYISEYPQLEDESDEHYNARKLTSGKYFGEQEILIDNVLWSNETVNGLKVNSQFFDGKIPKTLLFLEECKLVSEEQEDGTFVDMYEVKSKSLNEQNKVKSHEPLVTFQVDLPESTKDDDKNGYLVFRKKDVVTKIDPSVPLGDDSNSLLPISSGWEQITGFSSVDIKGLVDDAGEDITDRIKAAAFIDNNTFYDEETDTSSYSGYEPFTNETETRYKVIDSGLYHSPTKDNELTQNRVIDLNLTSQGASYFANGEEASGQADKTYTLERKVSRESNTEDFPAKWEVIEHNATFPYTDRDDLSDYKTTNVNFRVSGIYSTVETTGDNASEGENYFEVDLFPDWGKSNSQTSVTNRQETADLVFRSGEFLKVIQRSTKKITSTNPHVYDQYNSIDVHFSPYSTGQSGCLTGVGNETGFYELEYQLVPQKNTAEKLYYETGEGLDVGDRVYLNTGSSTEGIESDVFGGLPAVLSDQANLTESTDPNTFSEDGLASYFIDLGNHIRPESVPENAYSGFGYSYFNSGEEYLVVPKGGYNTVGSEVYTTHYSAGETTKTFFQGEQTDDINANYALTEYRTFDDNPLTEEEFLHKNERGVRISEKSICLGDSSTDLKDYFSPHPSFILDQDRRQYETYNTFTNASILNIDSENGEVDIANLKTNKKEFLNGVNLFFEKNYVASLTVLATGQKQDINSLASFMEKEKKYYIERDIYIDSDVYSQANSISPTFTSSESSDNRNPFSVSAATPNPFSMGEEKHYLTQVYHEDHSAFPYNDYDYYNSQPEILEEYTYLNRKDSIISDFSVNNITEARSYYPNKYESAIFSTSHKALPEEGYSILMNTGAHSVWPNGIDVGNYASNKADISFTGLNPGAYYEVQNRASAASDWKTVSPAVLATTEGEKITEKDVVDLESDSQANYRILEWFPSAVMLNYEGISVPSETPDSLILQSTASSNRVYDISKQEHSITNSSVTSSVNHELVFGGGSSLTILPHRSLDIQKGEFSLEFFLKSLNGDGTIFERQGAIKVYIDTNLKVDFNGETVINYEIGSIGATAKHIAICKHVVNRNRDYGTVSTISLFVDGERVFKDKEISYSDYSFISTKDLVIGSGLNATISHLRFYSGKSIYKDVDKFDIPTPPFTSESSPRKYKILKLNYNRIKGNSKWIINKNTFDNTNPPWDYQSTDVVESDETTKHSYEWFSEASNNQDNTKSRAMVNYLQRYAYRAPNNPHINKNYDGTPIEIEENKAIDLNSKVFPETYHYRVRRGGSDGARFTAPAPYYYEYKGDNEIFKIRNSRKGGEDNATIPSYSQKHGSFKNGSRLRVTKYVYRLYTKHAVVVGDSGYKNSRSSQQGWNYQLQYKVTGEDWKDVDSTESYQDYIVFMNEDGTYDPNSFENTDHSFVLPTLINKTSITEKYTPDQIKFRIEKRQNLTISNAGTEVDVFKKLNPLPIEVNIPVGGALLDLTQKAASDTDSKQEGYSTFDNATDLLTVNLDSTQNYILQKDVDEKILLSSDISDELKVRSIERNDFILDKRYSETEADLQDKFSDGDSAYSVLEDGRSYTINGLDKLFIYKDGASSKESYKSIVGVEPSGIELYRKEKSYKTSNSVGTAETISGLDPSQTKYFFTPDITSSHFDELQGMTDDALVDFTAKSFVTGNNEETVSTGISNIAFEPIHKFRTDIMTGKFTVDANDNGKTFLCSGANASGIISHGGDYSFDVFNISDNAIELFKTEADSFNSPVHTLSPTGGMEFSYKDSSLTSGPSTGVITPLPSIVSFDDNYYEGEDGEPEVFLIDGISGLDLSAGNLSSKSLLVNISDRDCAVAGASLGSMSGMLFDSDASRSNLVDSGVIVVDHDQIVLTSDDSGLTGVINTDSTLVLPSGFSDAEHVTFLNSKNEEARVISASGYGINEGAGTEAKSVYYIPKNEAVKFTLDGDNLNSNIKWSASSVDVVKYNQLEVLSSISDNKVFVHDEDVDVLVASNFSGKTFSVVRSQIDDIDFSDLRSQKTPILRVFVGDRLMYSAKPGVLGVKVTESGGVFDFEDIDVISKNIISIAPSSHGRVFCLSGSGEEVNFLFSNDIYAGNFEFFLITNKARFDLGMNFESQGNVYKFNDQEEGGEFSETVTGMDATVMVRVSKTKKEDGKEVAGEKRFFIEVVGQKGKGRRSSNVYKSSQEENFKEEILINRSRGLDIELPTLDSSYAQNEPYNVLYINASETSSNINYPVEAVSSDEGTYKDEQYSFSTKLHYYKNQEDSVSPYDNFTSTDIYKSPDSNRIKNGDVAIIDGSLASINLKSFLNPAFKIVNRFTEDTVAENLVRQISCGADNTLTLPNHGLVTNQRINFSCDRLTNADYFWKGTKEELETASNTIDGTALVDGDTVITVEGGNYFIYSYSQTVLNTQQESFVSPESDEMDITDEGAQITDVNKFFFRVNKGSNVTDVEAGQIFDFADDDITYADRLNDDADGSIASILSLSLNVDSDDGFNKTQTYFVEVVDENSFKLYSNRNSVEPSLSIASADFDANKYFLSDTFYVTDEECSRADIINLGDQDEPLKNFEENQNIFGDSPKVDLEKVVDLFGHSNGTYTSGDLAQSGVHFATGYNGAADGLNISSLSSSRHIVSYDKFHTRSSDLSDHNNDYFINSDLEAVEINGTTELNKNRAYKYSSSTFNVQDPSLSTSDIIYYPKNEIHIPNRKSLTRDQADKKFGYNFVFIKPDVHNEDLLIVLPSESWAGKLESVAVVNMHNRPITVVDFDRTVTQVVNANSAAFINNENFDTVAQHAIVSNSANGYSFSDSSVLEDGVFTVAHGGKKTEKYYAFHEGIFVLDYSTQHDKTIFVESNITFSFPYLYSPDGATNYVSSETYQPAGDDNNFKFELINISTKRKNELYFEKEIYPKAVYDVSVENFDTGSGFDADALKTFLVNGANQSKADKTNHAQTNLDSDFDYHVFGKEIKLDLSVYYRAITLDEAKRANFLLNPQTPIDLDESTYYRIVGVGGENNSTLTIANNIYENIKINSVTLVGDGLSEEEVSTELTYKQNLQNKILNYFADENLGQFVEAQELEDGQTTTIITTAITSNYLNKDKVLRLSVGDITLMDQIKDFHVSRIFDNQGNIFNSDSEIRYIDIDRESDIIHLKRENVYFDLGVSGDKYFRYVLTNPANVYLPSRKELQSYPEDVHFLIANASWESCNVICPEGTGVIATQAVASSGAIKIKWEKASNSFSVVADAVTVTVLDKTIFSCDYGAFLAYQPNTSSYPVKIHKDAGEIKIINNTASTFYVKNFNASKSINGSTNSFPVSKFSHTDFEEYKEDFNISRKVRDTEFVRIKDSGSLNKSIYENGVVLFDAATIKSFSMTEQGFFATNFVPLIRTKEFEDFMEGGTMSYEFDLSRGSLFTLEYFVVNEAGTIKNINTYRPCSFTSDGKNANIEKECFLSEFILDSSINDKIIMTNREYDYVMKKTNNVAFSLFSRFDEGLGEGVKMFRLDDSGHKFEIDTDSDDNYRDLLKASDFEVTKRNIFSVNQAGETISFLNQQTYTDYIDEVDGTYEEEEGEAYLIKTFYANKDEYKGKIIVFNKPYLISNKDPGSDTVFINNSKLRCYIDEKYYNRHGFEAISDYLEKSEASYEGFYNIVNKPKYLLTDNTKINVLNHNADAEFSGEINGLKVVNASNATLKCDGKIIYSLEAATYNSSTDISYSMCPTAQRKDWFLKLEGIDIPHQERDLEYYNEREAEAERLTQKRGANTEYKGTRYRFSNIFNTNRYEPEKERSGYESIAELDSRYIYGVTLYGNKRGEEKKIEYDADFTDYALSGLKLSWDMPQDTIAYSMNTGHERLSYCKEFDERNGLVTLSGVDKDRIYVVEDFEETYYNFVYSAVRGAGTDAYPFYKYLSKPFDTENFGELRSVKFQPRIKYNGEWKKPGEKFIGVAGVTDYQVEYIYFTQLKASQFISAQEDLKLLEEAEKEDLKEYNEELLSKVDKNTAIGQSSGVVYPRWSKVPDEGVSESEFMLAKVEKKTTNGTNKELIQGRKLKDIQGSYAEKVIESDDGEEVIEGQGYFEFKIPYDSRFTHVFQAAGSPGIEEVEFANEGSDAYKTDGYYRFKVILENVEVVVGEETKSAVRNFPGYEYEIKSSFKVTNNTGKDLLTVSLKSEDSAPFVANDTIRSLNLDFNTDAGQEAIMTDSGTYHQGFAKRVAIAQGHAKKTLKNSIGHSFIPFNRYGHNFYGLSFVSTLNKKTYSSIRFRLKKLIDKKLFFEDLKEGQSDDSAQTTTYNNEKSPIATYLDRGTSGLKYNLDTEVNSISYHDVARPGGVLKMKYPDWEDVVISNDNLKINKELSNGDAIVFKNDSGSIKSGQPYFIRFATAWQEVSEEVSAEVEVLRIFTTDTSIDGSNKIAYDGGIENNRYKIVNYFDLSYVDENSHRSKTNLNRNVLKNMYFYGWNIKNYEDPDPITTLNYPLVVGGLRLFLEAPLTEVGDAYIDTWGGRGLSGDSLRFNLELSAISKSWHGEDINAGSFAALVGLDVEYIGDTESYPSSHWVNEDIFSSYKNVLYRTNTQIELVEINEAGVSKILIKLGKNKNYRYIYKSEPDKITKVTLNGSDISAGLAAEATTGGEVFNTNEDLVIEMNVSLAEWEDEKGDPAQPMYSLGSSNLSHASEVKKAIYENLCIVELAEYVDPNPSDDKSEDDVYKVEYFDYQIPSLNSDEVFGAEHSTLKDVFPSYDTEGFSPLLSYGEKANNLVDYNNNGFTASLMYDMGMPAICEYVYLDFVNKKLLSFSITNFWDGFEHKFEGPGQIYRVQPIDFKYMLQKSTDGNTWTDIKEKIQKRSNFAISVDEELDSTNKFRMKIISVTIQYKREDTSIAVYDTVSLDKLRVPFKWTSAIKGSDLEDGVYDASSGLYMHTISMPENYKIGKSVSFPKDGFTRFGEFNYVKGGIPYTRLYMIDFTHSLRANYKDPIKRGGISKVVLTNRGENYRTEPTITIPAPTEDGGTQAAASAVIESGKVKHIEVANSGSGYSELSSKTKQLRKRIETSRASSIPVLHHTLEIISNTERSLSFSSPLEAFKAQSGLEIIDVIVTNNESSLPKEVQEEFGLTLKQTEKIQDYIKDENNGLRKSRDYPKVDLIKGTPDSDDWGFIQDIADNIQKRANFASEMLSQVKEAQSYGSDFFEEDSLGTENEFVQGLHQEHSSDANLTENVSSKIQFDGSGNAVIYETFPSVSSASALAIANNSSVADYRVINNKEAAKATPWLSSFSRSDNPALPKSFGIGPGSEVSSEVFNSYARAVNYLTKIRVEAPIYAKVRRYRQVQWRYISNPNMAGLTFSGLSDSGASDFRYGDLENTFDYYTHEDAISKVNFITYIDPTDSKLKVAHFSGFTGDGVENRKYPNKDSENPANINSFDGAPVNASTIWDIFEESMTKEGELRGYEESGNKHPKNIGLPNIVNIPEEMGVHCNPHVKVGGRMLKEEGVPLPTPVNKIAFAYGGDLVYSSPVYDVSDDTWPVRERHTKSSGEISYERFGEVEGSSLVDIRGSEEYIKAAYENQIVFGCQTNGKPFWSAFLRTVKVWTEYEIVSSPEFMESLPEGIRDRYRPEESKLRCELFLKRVTCSNGVIGKVDKASGYHNICSDGAKSFNRTHSYEETFNLSDGDNVIGPKVSIDETSSLVQAKAKDTFVIEPEFDLSLAIYSANESIKAIRAGFHHPNDYIGPCIHYCMPGQVKYLKVSNDPLIFDMSK